MNFLTKFKEYAKLSSTIFMFLTAIAPVVGAISIGEIRFMPLLYLFVLGCFGHIYGFALNHYHDVNLDRLSPELKERPLVSGTIKRKHALIYLLTALILATIMVLLYRNIAVLGFFVIAVLLVTFYDLFNKKFIFMDLILAISVVFATIMGSATVSLQFTPLNYIIFALIFLGVINMNMIAGALKDVDHDILIGAKTIAIKLGVRVTSDRKLNISKAFKILALGIAIIYSILVFLPLLLRIINYTWWQIIILVFSIAGFLIISYKMLNKKKFIRQEIRKYVVLHYNINWIAIPTILMSVTLWTGLLLITPLSGLIASNIILHRTIMRPQTM